MKTQKNTPIFVTLGLLALAASASAAFYFSQPQAVALAESQPTPVLPTQKVEKPQASPEILSKLPVVTDSDVTVEVTSARIVQRDVEIYTETDVKEIYDVGYVPAYYFEIGICYTTLDGGEWYPWPGHLLYGEYDIYPDQVEFLEGEKVADAKGPGIRCAQVRYLIEDPNTITLPIRFSVRSFYAPGRELYSPCQEMQQRLATSPKAQKYGLKISCTDDAEKNPSLSLDEYSKSVNAEDAQKVFDVIATSEVHGEWKFVLTDIEK